ncbi:MAG: Gfo/Idh/MocA family oxidoreductase [Verrucomicrobiota bacterium]|jgi:predicted dehydrogenase
MKSRTEPIAARCSRRNFLRSTGLLAAGAALGGPTVVPETVFGATAPNSRITIAFIGVGRQTFGSNIPEFMAVPGVQVVAVCDVDAWRLGEAKKLVGTSYAKQAPSGSYAGCAAYRDFREVIARPDVDAVLVGTPDHWHVPISLEAVRAGKDVSCEKPLTLSIAEGRVLADAVRAHGRVFRVDSEFRSLRNFHRLCELVVNGRIGKVHTIRTGVPKSDVACAPQPDMEVPEELDYDAWLGPAPKAPYTLNRVHPRHDLKGRPGWMRRREYCEGLITNWGTHLNDIAQWGNRTESTGPVEVEARGVYPPPESFWNVLLEMEAQYRFANGVTLHYKMDRPFVRFEGEEGWVESEYQKEVLASSESVLKSEIRLGEIRLPFKTEKQDFIDAVRTRGRTLEDAEVGHRTCSLCQIAHIAIQLGGSTGRKLRWDPERERFDDPAANKLLDRPSWRAPWTLHGPG